MLLVLRDVHSAYLHIPQYMYVMFSLFQLLELVCTAMVVLLIRDRVAPLKSQKACRS